MRPFQLSIVLGGGIAAWGVACSGGGGGGGGADAPGTVPAMITISGIASARSTTASTPVAGLTVAAFKSSDDSMVQTGTTNGSGVYSLVITTNGVALDGYIKATGSDSNGSAYVDTYLYPAAPLTADFSTASINMLSPVFYGLIYTLTDVTETSGDALIALETQDATTATVAGVSVSSTPAGTDRYDSSGGLPTGASQTTTQADGVAYILNVPAGQVTLSATLAGATFKSHAVNARADVFTTTIVSE